jgi:hypothetical protein
MSFRAINMKSGREKGENAKEKEVKGKMRKREVKGGKNMQNKVKLRQKDHNRSRKTTCARGGNYHFQKGG